MRSVVACVLMIGCALPGMAAALSAGQDFEITVVAGNDTVPPPTPSITSAIPVAASQIDITWTAVVDDVFLDGYTIARDGVPIATTTLTTYSDTGLLASTTYTYTVRAFDHARNYSSSSAPVATTTLQPPPPPVVATTTTPTRSVTRGTVVRLLLEDFGLKTNATSAQFAWRTNAQSRYALRWGRTGAHELGYVISDSFRLEHGTEVTGLEPGTTYDFELVGVTPGGAESVLQRGEFTTLAAEQSPRAVPNVRRLQATVADETVTLTWINPALRVDDRIRVVRNHRYFPRDPRDGILVYQGQGNRVIDAGALAQYSPQYYTVFVIRASGEVSSGALVQASKTPADTPTDTSALPPPELPVRPVTPETAEVYAATGTPLLPLENITLMQQGEVWSFADPVIALSALHPFRVRIPATTTPTAVQTIVATVLDPTDHRRSFSFLLRLNQDRTAYEALVAPLDTIGISVLEVAVYNLSQQVVSRYRHQINFVSPPRSIGVIFPDVFMPWLVPILSVVLFGSGIFFWLLRRSRTEDNL